MWAVAKTILKDSSTPQTRIALLNFILLHNPQFEKDSEDILLIKEIIQDLISSPITRNEGYLLLDAVTKSNPSVFVHNWGPIIISSLKNPDSSVSKPLTLRILTRMVVNFSGNPTLYEAFQLFIPEIVSLLLKTAKSDEDATNCCKALAVCMQHLPAIVGPFSDEIESFLMEHAGSIDFKTEEGIAHCFAAIPICLENKLKPKPSYSDVWLDVFLKLLNTLQALLNDFLRHSDADDNCVSIEELPLLPTPRAEEENDEYTVIFKRIKIFSSLCKCLAKMMSVHTDSNLENIRVKVPVQDLLKCLERIFHVYDLIKTNHRSTESSVMNLAYPVLQISALSVLESLIINFTVIEHSGNLVTFLNKIVQTTVSEPAESWACYVRSSAWKVADAWLKYYGPKSSYNIVNNKLLISELLKDITPDQEIGPPQTARVEKFGSGDMRENCCLEALNVLTSMFVFGGAFMHKDFINEICGTVLKVSCKVHQSSHPAKKFVYPYTNKYCRLNLYQCLFQASVSDPMQTKYVKQAINIFRFATKDPYLEVRTKCFSALHTFRFYINPKKPLPEALATRAEPPQEEEQGWHNGFNWNIQHVSPQAREEEQQPMDVGLPIQIAAVYHNSMGSDSQPDMRPTPPPHYADGLESRALPEALVNGGSPNEPSHSNADSGSEDIMEYPSNEAPAIAKEAPNPHPTNPRPTFVALRPAQPHSLSPAQQADEDSEESPLRMPSQNGVYEENSDGEEEVSEEEYEGEGEGSEDEDIEENGQEGYAPQYEASRYSPVSEENERAGPSSEEGGPERKRQRMSEEADEHSASYSEEEECEEPEPQNVPTVKLHNQESADEEESADDHHPIIHMMSNSPTVDEMCQDFVLAEPEEIR